MKFSPRTQSASTTTLPSPSCSVLKFEAPKNMSGCNINPNPSVVGVNKYFEMEANFENAGLSFAACEKCEYRQDVKGYFKVTKHDGTEIFNTKLLAPGVELSQTEFREDGGLINGSWGRYGHREDPSGIWTLLGDAYTPAPRTTGCHYKGADAPGGAWPRSTYKSYEVNLTFRGKIINPTTGDVLHSKTWNVHCIAT